MLIVIFAVVCGQPVDEMESELIVEHDLDTAEFVLELIEKKIAK